MRGLILLRAMVAPHAVIHAAMPQSHCSALESGGLDGYASRALLTLNVAQNPNGKFRRSHPFMRKRMATSDYCSWDWMYGSKPEFKARVVVRNLNDAYSKGQVAGLLPIGN